ncbi:MAG: ThuA domain-containing protein [Acidimicrobiales bacterium]
MAASVLAGACGTTSGDAAGAPATGASGEPRTIVLFSRTEGFRHSSIEPAVEALRPRLTAEGFAVVATEDPDALQGAVDGGAVAAVVFVSTTGDVLDPPHEAAMERFVRAGGGFAGVHAAADTEYDWPFYGELLGTWFADHPPVAPGTVERTDVAHRSTAGLPDPWARVDEWYRFRSAPADRSVLLTHDGEPVAWSGTVDDGAVWYTALGHTDESWADPLFVDHVVAGITSVT